MNHLLTHRFSSLHPDQCVCYRPANNDDQYHSTKEVQKHLQLQYKLGSEGNDCKTLTQSSIRKCFKGEMKGVGQKSTSFHLDHDQQTLMLLPNYLNKIPLFALWKLLVHNDHPQDNQTQLKEYKDCHSSSPAILTSWLVDSDPKWQAVPTPTPSSLQQQKVTFLSLERIEIEGQITKKKSQVFFWNKLQI